MHLIYFDENKFSVQDPFFYIGGIMLPSDKIRMYDETLMRIQYNFFGTSILRKETEFHGKDIFHGKGNFRKYKLEQRIGLLHDLVDFIVNNTITIRLVCIDVVKHQAKYVYPEPEYRLGLMLFLERTCDFLDKENSLGLVFGDYEKDEITNSILDFSQFKHTGKTKMYSGRPLGRLIDTIYFTHSHHSRFLQLADVIIFLANRYDQPDGFSQKWHEQEGLKIWKYLIQETDVKIQRWP